MILIGGLAVLQPAFGRATAVPMVEGTGVRWTWDAAAGFDSFSHTYALSLSDTSETVTESFAQLAFEGESAPGARQRWRARVETSAGSDLWRERLEADWRRLDEGGVSRLRALVRASARQYRENTDYTQSSDHVDGRLDLQAVPLAGPGAELFALGWGGATRYARASPLEQDQHEMGVGLGARSRGLGATWWSAALRHASRSYPDSTAIDRRTWSAEAELARAGDRGGTLRLYLRDERRLSADPQTRPDAWTHWLDAASATPALAGEVIVEVQAERWTYDQQTLTYLDNWRLGGLAGYRRGDVLAAQWLLGLAAERYSAGDSPESYDQAGLRAGLESYGSRLSGTLRVEYGRRLYEAIASGDVAVTAVTYSDFNYWRLWLMADIRLTDELALAAFGTWEPERHSESQDDVTIGSASLRLVWRR